MATNDSGNGPTEYVIDIMMSGPTVAKMKEAGFAPAASFNPYWDREGMTFEDPDGYRIVLQRAAWTR